MSAKHTPGPWAMEISTKSGEATIRGLINDGTTRSNDNTGSIALVDLRIVDDADTIMFPCCNPEREANARLIAAAPDLLEALTDARAFLWDSWRSHDTKDNFVTDPLIKQIDAALTKAIGET